MDIFSVLTLVGGLAMFLFGMNYMGDSLKKLSGSSLESVLSRLTSSRIKGFLLGFGVTAVIQSSSAVMVMLVGFVNSGIMKLAQTTSVLMGANIGTTVTGWLLSTSGISGGGAFARLLNPSSFSPVLAAVGLLMNMLSKNDKKKNVGSILLGFSILMFGMETMSDATEGLQNSPVFSRMLVTLSNPLAGILAGTLFTAIIQSSSASIGILQALSLTSAIPISSALPIILGMNIGAALPPVLSALSGNTDAKRVAASCVTIKIIGVTVTASVFFALHSVLDFPFMAQNANVFSIALLHTAFNVISTALLLPFCRGIEKLSELIFRHKSQEPDLFDSLDDRFLSYPSFAAEKARELTADMARRAEQSVQLTLSLLEHYDEEVKHTIEEQEKTVDLFEDKLHSYLVALSGRHLTSSESAEVTTLLHIISDVERISDYARNLSDAAKEMSDGSIRLSESAVSEMELISAAVQEIVHLSVAAIGEKDYLAALKIAPLNKVVAEISRRMKENHIMRLQNNECSTEFGFVFATLLTHLGRIAGHCSNIAVYLLQKENSTFSPHEYKSQLKEDKTDHFQDFYDSYRRTYKLS